MKPLVELPDAEREVIDVLLDAGHATVSTQHPTAPLTGSAYRLHVELEASDVADYPIAERAQVRVTVHAAAGRATAIKQLCSDVLADLYTFIGSTNVAGIVPISGRSDVSIDPATTNAMCWVLLRVDLKATTVAP